MNYLIILQKCNGIELNLIKEFLENQFYMESEDSIKVDAENGINTVIVLVHEFIHRCVAENKSHIFKEESESIFCEIPSIYFERQAMKYLIENGYDSLKEELNEFNTFRELLNKENSLLDVEGFLDIVKFYKQNCIIKDENVMNLIKEKSVFTTVFVSSLEIGKKSSNMLKVINQEELYAVLLNYRSSKKSSALLSYTLGVFLADKHYDDKYYFEKMLKYVKGELSDKKELMSLLDIDENVEEFERKDIIQK